MSLPTEADFGIVKMGDGASPTEVFTTVCGIQDVAINETVATEDRFVPDCANPGSLPQRKSKPNGRQVDVSATGLINLAQIATVRAALGVAKNYKIELYNYDSTTSGTLIGTLSGSFMLTANNMNVVRQGNSSAEMTFASQGATTYA